ncbi:uncharacterized protein LOC135397247 [Ornithodoros turicata]|uniref:uncharacterized protein LOC135397247 n=1 Tax=Ornithodoros turicata TaxID=34597 RepID=UPI0031388F7D
MAEQSPDTNRRTQSHRTGTVARHSTPLNKTHPGASRSQATQVGGPPFHEDDSMQLSPVVGRGRTTQLTDWEATHFGSPLNATKGVPVRRTFSWNEDVSVERSTRLHELEASLQRKSRLYRRRLTTRLVCVFFFLVLLGVVICCASVALLVRNETARGILVGYDGSFQLKSTNESYCFKGNPTEVAAYRENIIRGLTEKMDAVFGNMSTESSYSGSLVEDFACVLRASSGITTVHVYFVLLWRQRRSTDGTLQAVPDSNDLVQAFSDYLKRNQISAKREVNIPTDTIEIGGYHRIL